MIGVYDSGYGGLTVLRALRAALPDRDFCYLGDSGRAPYGGRDTHTILDFAEQCTERLFEEGCRLVVVACHTVSCVALRHLQRRYAGDDRRVLGVTIPTAEAAVAASDGHVCVLGTARTVASGTFVTEIAKLGPHRVTQRAAPLLAPIVEEGWEDTEIARLAVARYLDGIDADTIVLGCTHYPLLARAIRAQTKARVLDPSSFVADRTRDWLDRHPGFDDPGAGAVRYLCTGDPAVFRDHGARFLGEPIGFVRHVAEEAGRLAPRETVQVAVGQVVR
ncbi:MAG: glutamate racemase [Myxococcota bacterium]